MILFLLLLFSLSFGEEVIKLDLQKVYELALNNNAEIKKLRYEIESLEFKYKEAKNYFLPYINLGAGLIYNSKTEEWEKPFGVSLVSVIYEYNKTLPRIKGAELRYIIKKEALSQLERDIKVRILELFSQANLYKKLTEVKREEMAIAYVRFDRARERKELGLTTNWEVYKLESIYREKRMELLKAQHEYNKALLEIKKLAGIDLNALVELDDIPFEPKAGEIDWKRLIDYTLKNNPILKIKSYKVELYDYLIKEASNILSPRVQIRGEIGNSVRAGFPQTRAYNQTGWRGGIEVFIPLFDAPSIYNVESLNSEKRAMQVELKDTVERYKLLAMSSAYEYSYLLAKWDFAKTKDRYAEENLNLRRSEYELELAFDLGYAMAEKTQSEMELMQAKYELLLFLARLYNMAGLDPFMALEDSYGFVKGN